MTVPLSSEQRDRLVRFLEIARTTQHEGEAANALTFANRTAREAGVGWGELIPPPLTSRSPRSGTEQAGGWRDIVRRCQAHPHKLRPWEVGFLDDLGRFPRLSVKQAAILREIAERVLS